MRIAVSIFLICTTFICTAQELPMRVAEDQLLIDGVSTPVQSATVMGDVDALRDSWKKFCRKKFDLKMKGKGEIVRANKVVVNQITDRRGDLILFCYPLEEEVSFNLAFQLGYDVFLNAREFPGEAQNLQEFAEYFLYHYYYDFLDDFLNEQEKELKRLQKEKKQAEKAARKTSRRIKKTSRKIARNAEHIDRLQADINDEESEEKRVELREKRDELAEEVREMEAEVRASYAPIKENKAIVASLEPKMAALEESLARNRLLYLEARDKVRSYR